MINLIEELKWRGMIHDIMPGTDELLQSEQITGYIGFDPTSDSLHIGNLAPIMLLVHLQKAGHKPIALIGGATAMIGDPSGKSEERKLLSEETIRENEKGIRKQLSKFLNFESKTNPAELVNNQNWYSTINTLMFLREAGKYLTVSYLLGKETIRERLKKEMSFTEFNYVLMQAYDFLWLKENKNCKLQMGGSDQWGNITAGSELIRKKLQEKVFGFTCPLITKSDGGKFGKTEEGNVWLDAEKTSPYKFYQFWLNTSDEDVRKYIRIFTLLSKQEIESLESQHTLAPHTRILQHELAKQVTTIVHSQEDYHAAVEASQILFGQGTTATLKQLNEKSFLDVFEGVPQTQVAKSIIEEGINITEFLVKTTRFLSSNNEARRALQENSLWLNKEKIAPNYLVSDKDLINNKYIVLQRGKKNYFLVKVIVN